MFNSIDQLLGGTQEADDLVKRATKLVTPSFLTMKLKGDWLQATPMYERAAMLYRVGLCDYILSDQTDQKALATLETQHHLSHQHLQQAKNYSRAKECYEKAATGQERQHSPWHAAKNLEKAGEMANELRDYDALQEAFSRASELYCEEGRQSNAAEALAKAARLLEDPKPDAAADTYKQAIDMLEDSGKDTISGDIYRQGIAHLVRSSNWPAAVAMLQRFAVSCDRAGAISSQCKTYLSAVIVWLYAGNAKEAWNTYQDALSVDTFVTCDEAFAAEALIEAYRSADAEAIAGVVKRQHAFGALDNVIVRLAKKLPGEGVDLVAMSKNLGGASALNAALAAADEDEDDLT